MLAGLGPAPLRPGMRLAVGDDAGELPNVDVAPVPAIPEEIVLRVVPGPRDDWFAPAALRALTAAAYEVTTQSNRVGIRLSGATLERSTTRELPSEGTVCGADRKSTRLNSSHANISYAVFCLKKKAAT